MSAAKALELVVNTAGSILGKPDVTADDSFFDLGATSLDAARLVAVLEDQHDLVVDLEWIFTSESLAQLAAHTTFRVDLG